MKNYLAFILCLVSAAGFAQSFTNSTGTQIPNTGNDLRIPVNVSGLTSTIDAGFGLSVVCFDILHTADANLRIRLQSPDSTIVTLVDQKGGNGDNFQGTCLAENGSGGYVMTGTAPFIGSYLPVQSINLFNNGQNPNGTWYFIITDLFIPSDTGSFNSVTLTFGINPPADPPGGPCSMQNAGACFCKEAGESDCDLLPDITSSYLSIIDDHVESPGSLVVGVATPNIGWGPLEVHGIDSCFCDTVHVPCQTVACPDGSPPTQMVTQRIYHKNVNTMTYWDRPAGTMSYHPSHGHIHVDYWLDYTLRVPTPNPDARTWPVIGIGNKQSFCLINLFDCDQHPGYCVDSLGNTLVRADFQNADFGSVSGCTNDQGIYVGNADEYNSWLNGAGILIPTACNQTYYVVTITDPLNNFLETNEENNWVAVPITLTQQTNGNFLPPGFIYTLNGLQINATTNANNPDSVMWIWGDGTESTVFNQNASHTFPHNGFYIVYCYAYNQCGPIVTTDTIMVYPNVGIDEGLSLSTLQISPNPTTDQVTITFTSTAQSKISLEIMNELGESIYIVREEEIGFGKFSHPVSAHSLGMLPGVYWARLSNRMQSITQRFIVLK